MLNFIFINRYKIGVALIFAGVGGITIGVIIAHFAGFPEGEVIDYFNWMPRGWLMQTIGQLIAFGCLLYTSPSPRDEQSSRMPSSA